MRPADGPTQYQAPKGFSMHTCKMSKFQTNGCIYLNIATNFVISLTTLVDVAVAYINIAATNFRYL